MGGAIAVLLAARYAHLVGRVALQRSEVAAAGTEVRGVRERHAVPRAYLHPEVDGSVPGAEALRAAGVRVRAVPECGHHNMLDSPEGFARAVAEALRT
ncbi:alpha/beta fold hydrolase [Streptomyces sp. P6-2-1]|uniref:alpha/beta fold hydrolase n=1 Tax=Streptomyces sp. P6-2-1 TaxID=3422591 RepID=UPI003D36C07F